MIEQAKKQIDEIINTALTKAREAGALSGTEPLSGAVEIPRDASHGDFASTHALGGAKALKMPPRKIAEILADYIDLDGSFFTGFSIAGPGFVNFVLSVNWYGGVLRDVEIKGADYGSVNAGGGKRVMVEFVSANPTGPMTVGNARGGVLGDTLASILKKAGWKPWREFYVNDAGHQVEIFAQSIRARYLQLVYGEDSTEFPEDGYHGDYIKEFAEDLYNTHGKTLADMPERECLDIMSRYGLEQNIKRLHSDMERYGIIFDRWFHETELHNSGYVEETIELVKERGVTYEKEGALWLKGGDEDGDKDEVLRKSNGFYTYYAVDIAYHRDKLSRRAFDKVIDVLGADHHGHTLRFKTGIDAAGLDSEKLDFLLFQFVNLVRGGEVVKMSKRTGRAITLADLLDEISRDAARFLFSLRSPDTTLDFDMDLAVRQDSENPVYYVQYAHARICSLIAMLASDGHTVPACAEIDASVLTEAPEKELLFQIALLPEEVRLAARDYDPSRINKYVIELAARFHKFYNACRIKGETPELVSARLKLADTTRAVIKICLELLGVTAPEKM